MTDAAAAAADVPRNGAVLLANGPLGDAAAARLRRAAVPEGGRWRIGVDGGAARMLALGIVPEIVTGDFDSLARAERAALEAAGARLVPTPDQDFTDLDKALAYCRDVLEVPRVDVFGATGGRLDHTFSALSALVKHGRVTDVRLVDDVGETRLVRNGALRLAGADLSGRVLSLIALGPVHDIWSRGVRWPLSGEALAPGVRDGTVERDRRRRGGDPRGKGRPAGDGPPRAGITAVALP
jgi:thiamine pyrophosphokinase